MTSPSTNTAIPNRYGIPLFLALIAAGLAGNYFKFPIFLNTDFLFGSIFAMLVLQLFGLGRGIVAAAIIASYTWVIWNHPSAIIILTAEVAAVGWLMERRKMGMVLADTLYWLIIGMPLAYLLYHVFRHIPFGSDAYFVMTKQAVNGIANALAARLIFIGYKLRSHSSLTPYREIVYNMLAFFVLCPALIMLAVGSRTDFAETDSLIRSSLVQDSGRVAQRLETWVENRKSAILTLAEMAASESPLQMQPYLKLAKRSDSNFRYVALQDIKGTTTAVFPLLDARGQNLIGRNYADRPFIPTLKQTLKPMLSEVVTGRTGTPEPMVSILAPVVIRGKFGGHVIGILGLDQIQQYLDKSLNLYASLYTLLDKNGNVIMTNRTDQKAMTPFVRGKGTLIPLDQRLSQWIPVVPPNTPISERWKKSFYCAETSIGSLSEWKLILEQPVAPFQKSLYENYTAKLSMLFLILIGALVLAEIFSRRSIVTLEELRLITRDLPTRLATDSIAIKWPESNIMEADQLINNFRRMADSLSEQFIEIRQINESLEQRVEERTLKIEQLANEQRVILSTMPIGASFLKDRKIQMANPAFDIILGYEVGETMGMNTIDIYSTSETFERIGHEGYEAIASGGIFPIDAEMKKKDGSYIWCSMVGRGVNPGRPEDGAIWMIQDITERKRSEDALRSASLYTRTLIEATLDPLVTISAEGKITDVNEASVRITGIPRNQLINTDFTAYFTDPGKARDVYLRVFSDGYVHNYPLAIRNVSGGITDVLYNASIYRDEHGDVKGVIAAARDVTDRNRAEERIKRSLQEKEVLLKEIHHRVKNNMQVIYSLLNLQAKSIADSQVRSVFEESRDRINSMSLIHENLYQSEDLAHIDFKKYLEILVQGIADTYGRKEVNISVEMEPVALDVNVGIPCGLIVNELVSNSLKYAFPEGEKGTLTVGINRTSEEGYLLTVADNGIGFPEDLDFRRTKTLGMQLVTILTRQIHGTIELVTEEGTAFRITFPGNNGEALNTA